ncbi:ribonuclease Z [Paenibacillus sp. GSMTC-2017]|uniref:ribonuclease Z n=1 Tax=Paenibacillus sp. GSMTC-2017 TaxID=2794350 RepID=UPI0018D73000|nr:ribonuclease Z [Paenibacillus sp. GSMTC-2017]MBH5317768.1 ribonuclease Z [Paenibacillus sp. GSMTC-2017]
MKLWFLGTGAGRPSKHRNVTALALQLPEPLSSWWLFDAGEATQHQIMKTPLKLNKLEMIFVSHLHGDHLYGLPGLLSSRSFDGGITPVTMFGPVGLRKYIETIFDLTGTMLDYELIIHELAEESATIYESDKFQVEVRTLEHRISCFGYRITEYDTPGKLKVDRLRELGIEAGPLYGKLKKGESVTLSCGTVIQPEDVIDGINRGRIVTILGDTSPCESAMLLAQNADVLVHEATFAAGMEEKAHEFGHCTTVDAATTAKLAGARKLVLTHFSGRYSNEELQQLEEEASAVFTDSVAAIDLGMIEVNR